MAYNNMQMEYTTSEGSTISLIISFLSKFIRSQKFWTIGNNYTHDIGEGFKVTKYVPKTGLKEMFLDTLHNSHIWFSRNKNFKTQSLNGNVMKVM